MDSVGERIKEIRLKKGITQADLAVALDTTTAAISRYELGKRERRFAQVQTIADVLGVSVFELYGFPSERQIQIENSQRMLSRIKEEIQRNSEGTPDETLQYILQLAADFFEKDLQETVNLATIAHNAQVQATLLSQPEKPNVPPAVQKIDLAQKRRDKRVDNLVSMFCNYSDDTQSRILNIVAIFGRLNSAGQKYAVRHIKELAELPRYQIQKAGHDKT